MTENQITDAIIGAAIRIHRALGPGLLEAAYEACLVYELSKASLRVERQKDIPLVYENVKLDCGFRADLLVEDRVLVELKAVEHVHPVCAVQLLSYLRLMHLEVGLLINFHVPALRDGVKRVVNNYKE